MQISIGRLSLFVALFGVLNWEGALGQTVEFRIKAGTGKGDWNTRATMVTLKVGDTLKFVNDDAVAHALHTEDDIPFKHTKAIRPHGGVCNTKILAVYDSQATGPLHDHESSGVFWIKAVAEEETDDIEAGVTIDSLLGTYSTVHDPLVTYDLDKSQAAAKSLGDLSLKWLSENPDDPQAKSVATVRDGAKALVAASDIDEARIAFIKVSQGAIGVIRTDNGLMAKWQLFFCPMVAKKQGYWVQAKGEALSNPYMGSTMPGCGSKKPW